MVSGFEEVGLEAFSRTDSRYVVFPQVTALGVSAETMLSTGLGRLPVLLLEDVVGGELEAGPNDMNGFLRLAAKLAAKPEFALLKDLESSGDVDSECV